MTATSAVEKAATDRYLISIATYRRLDDLRRLLDSLAVSTVGRAVDVVVVDNDDEKSARELVLSHALQPAYDHEPEAGIAAARNRGLRHFTEDHVAVIFVDDDEWVEPDWFDAITTYAERSTAGVVQGPVITVVPEDAPVWIRRGGFYQRPVLETGAVLESAATNNTLLKMTAWRAAECPRFDPDFSLTGGSDWDFFWGIRGAGAHIHFCAEAIVSEDVPPSRLSRRWLRRRYMRGGMVSIRVMRKHGNSVVPELIRAAAVLTAGCGEYLLDLVSGRGVRSRPMRRICVSAGKFAAVAGIRIHEYRR